MLPPDTRRLRSPGAGLAGQRSPCVRGGDTTPVTPRAHGFGTPLCSRGERRARTTRRRTPSRPAPPRSGRTCGEPPGTGTLRARFLLPPFSQRAAALLPALPGAGPSPRPYEVHLRALAVALHHVPLPLVPEDQARAAHLLPRLSEAVPAWNAAKRISNKQGFRCRPRLSLSTVHAKRSGRGLVGVIGMGEGASGARQSLCSRIFRSCRRNLPASRSHPEGSGGGSADRPHSRCSAWESSITGAAPSGARARRSPASVRPSVIPRANPPGSPPSPV